MHDINMCLFQRMTVGMSTHLQIQLILRFEKLMSMVYILWFKISWTMQNSKTK